MEPIQLVWFKRDLRVRDHRPLFEATQRGPVLPLYIVEPSVLHAPDADARHWEFVRGCLIQLRANLAHLGQPLAVRQGEAVAVLAALHAELAPAGGIGQLWAHEETGNGLTFARDKAVRRWLRATGIPVCEIPQRGVVRGLTDRDLWDDLRDQRLAEPAAPVPRRLRPLSDVIDLEPGPIPSAGDLGLPASTADQAQPGGEGHAQELLQTFLTSRGVRYQREMSSPLTAADACSRLSPHLAYGTISTKRVLEATARRRQTLAATPAAEQATPGLHWPDTLDAFTSRLAWRDHFVQKLEREPRIEFESFVPAYDALRAPDFRQDYFDAWATGHTGYPLVDACMRSLHATGWLTFRMRALLVSFAAYDLWLHWRQPALHLARLFTDYEPGIHYCQLQMQSGTTGVDATRVYSPVKQSMEQDPFGDFIRRWVPELEPVPDAYIHLPWHMPGQLQARLGVRIGRAYPAPIVAHDAAVRGAKARLAEVRRRPDVIAEAARIRHIHGSRRRRTSARPTAGRATEAAPQLSLWSTGG